MDGRTQQNPLLGNGLKVRILPVCSNSKQAGRGASRKLVVEKAKMILFSLRLALNCETSDCKSTKLCCPCNFRLSRLSLISPLENNNLKKIQASRSAAGFFPYLKAWFSRLFCKAIASTSGPPSAMNLASFSAQFFVSSSSGGETLSRLSVLGPTHTSNSQSLSVLRTPRAE